MKIWPVKWRGSVRFFLAYRRLSLPAREWRCNSPRWTSSSTSREPLYWSWILMNSWIVSIGGCWRVSAFRCRRCCACLFHTSVLILSCQRSRGSFGSSSGDFLLLATMRHSAPDRSDDHLLFRKEWWCGWTLDFSHEHFVVVLDRFNLRRFEGR